MSDLAGARMAFDQAAGWVGRISNEYFNSWAGFELVRGLFEAAALSGEAAFSRQAGALLPRIQNPYFRLLARCEGAKHLLAFGRRKEVRALIAELEKEASALDKDHSRASALCECAEVRERLGDTKGAEKDLAEAERIASNIDNSYFRSWAQSGLVRSSARIARETGSTRCLEKYRGTVERLEDLYLRSWAWAELARTMCKLKDLKSCRNSLDSAWDAAKEVKDPVNAAMGMTETALASLDQGNRELAEQALNATNIRAEESKEHQKALVLAEGARMMAALGDELGAKRRIQDAIDLAQPVGYEYFRAWALSGVVRALVFLGVALAKKQ
ncbi:MAG: hypothetical protein FJ149_07760 [Euryarchaeota archaeon]|nr:hypothetical protein [Euryarchaeota archaeon]